MQSVTLKNGIVIEDNRAFNCGIQIKNQNTRFMTLCYSPKEGFYLNVKSFFMTSENEEDFVRESRDMRLAMSEANVWLHFAPRYEVSKSFITLRFVISNKLGQEVSELVMTINKKKEVEKWKNPELLYPEVIDFFRSDPKNIEHEPISVLYAGDETYLHKWN